MKTMQPCTDHCTVDMVCMVYRVEWGSTCPHSIDLSPENGLKNRVNHANHVVGLTRMTQEAVRVTT
jgi:hypothetical protein